MTVPSEIVAHLDARFPAAGQEQPFYLEYAYAPAVAHILRLLDDMPSGILILKGEALAEYGEAVESLRTAVEVWHAGDKQHVLEKIPGRNKVNPLTFLRRHLSTLNDEVVSPATADLALISDPALRAVLRQDIAGANRSFGVADWKGCTVLSGSVVEALLLWAVERREAATPGSVATSGQALVASGRLGQLPPANLDLWNLNQLTEVSRELGMITAETATQCHLAREFRNLIHPGRAKRLAQKCNRATALSALAAIEHVVDDLG